jgi:hypothetical protein
MPCPDLRSTSGPRSEFYCSACELKFRTQPLSPDMKASLQKEWDDHLSSIHPRYGEYEQKKRAIRQASREWSSKRWRIITASSVLGFVVALLVFWVTYLNLGLRVEKVFSTLCPPSVLTLIYMDVPGTTADYMVTWAEVALLNAGLYGAIGAIVSTLFNIRRSLDYSRS